MVPRLMVRVRIRVSDIRVKVRVSDTQTNGKG